VLLLYLNFGSLRDALLAASVIRWPWWAASSPLGDRYRVQRVLRHRLRRAVGIAAMDGILVLSYYHLSLDWARPCDGDAADLQDAAAPRHHDVYRRVRGLDTAAFSTASAPRCSGRSPCGGGRMLLAPVLILLVLPVLILKFSAERDLRRSPPWTRTNEALAHRSPPRRRRVRGTQFSPAGGTVGRTLYRRAIGRRTARARRRRRRTAISGRQSTAQLVDSVRFG